MTAVLMSCRDCGSSYTPERADLLRGPAPYRACQDCRPAATPPPDDPGGRCEQCGRALRTKGRSICLGCLTGGMSP